MAREAGDLTLRRFQVRIREGEIKHDGTVVTIADREAESLLREAITREFPEDAILGEEFGETTGTTAFRWVLDPIDGTASFVHGVPLYGTLVAVERQDAGGPRSVVGVIYMPGLREMVAAADGLGCLHAPGPGRLARPARVSRTASLAEATLVTTSVDYFAKHDRQGVFLEAVSRFQYSRGWSDCYAHVLVATGRADVCIEPTLAPWDAAPLPVIMREAGGMYSGWDGRETAHAPDGVSSNGLLHAEVLALLGSGSA